MVERMETGQRITIFSLVIILSGSVFGWAVQSSFVVDGVTRKRIEEINSLCHGKDQIRCFSDVIAEEGDDDVALAMRAVAYHVLKRYEEALQDIDRAILLDGKQPGYFALRAEIRTRLGDLENAERDADLARDMTINRHPELVELDEILATNPEDTSALLRRSEISRSRGDFGAAAVDLEKAIQVSGSAANPRLYSLLAESHLATGDAVAAEKVLSEGIVELGAAERSAAPLFRLRALIREESLGDLGGARLDRAEAARILESSER